MDTFQINKQLKCCKKFLGTYPCDQLPPIKSKPAFTIINTDPSDKPGEHWIAVYFKNDDSAEYFDSFGLPPLEPLILDYILSNSTRWSYNTFMLQDIFGITCGNYCVLYVKLRCMGYSFVDFISLFTHYQNVNDLIVKKLYKR